MQIRAALLLVTLSSGCIAADDLFGPARQALAAGDFNGALTRLDHLSEQFSESAPWHGLAAEAWEGLHEPARAVAECERALALEPGREQWHLQLGEVFLRYHTPQAALDVFSDALVQFPGSLLLRLGRGLAYKDLNRNDEAEADFLECLHRDPSLALAFDAQATLYLQNKRYDDVISLSRRFRSVNGADYRTDYFEAAARFANLPEDTRAEPLVRDAIRRNPRFAAAHALLGKMLLSAGDPESALKPLQEAVRLRPDYSPAFLYLSKAYQRLGRTHDSEEALAGLRKAKEMENVTALSLAYHRGSRPAPR